MTRPAPLLAARPLAARLLTAPLLVALLVLPGAAAAQDLAARCAGLAAVPPAQMRLQADIVAAAPSWSPVAEAANPVQPASPLAAKPFAVAAPFCCKTACKSFQIPGVNSVQ